MAATSPNTFVLGLQQQDRTSYPPHYQVNLANDATMSASLNAIDAWAGQVSASFHETFYVSGAIDNHLGTGTGSSGIGAGEFYGGLSYAPYDRVITEVVAFQRTSGSGGVTTVNVLTGSNGNSFVSIFSSNALKPALSASSGDFFIGKSSTFQNVKWPKGYLLGVALDTIVTAKGNDLTVQVYWKPSASFA